MLSPFKLKKGRTLEQEADLLQQQGFTRLEIDGQIMKIADIQTKKPQKIKETNIVIDRFAVSDDEDFASRVADSVQTAFYESKGECALSVFRRRSVLPRRIFSNSFEADGMVFEIPSVHMFSFNNPVGACPLCEGYGRTIGIDEDLVIPNKSLSVYNEAIVCWKGEKMSEWKDELIMNSDKFNFPIHKPIYELTPEQRKLLWTGNRYFKGLNTFFQIP